MHYLNLSSNGPGSGMRLVSILLLLLMSAFRLSAECSVQASITPTGKVRLEVVNPDSNSTYNWVTSLSLAASASGNGYAAEIDYPNAYFTITFMKNGVKCITRPVFAISPKLCETARFTSVFDNATCSVNFFPEPVGGQGSVQRFWNFGDKSPVIASNTSPTNHMYNFPGGTFSVTLWVIQDFPAGINIERCTQDVGVYCTPPITVNEIVECCVLRLRVSGGYPECDHSWEIINGNNQVCQSFSTPTFEFWPTNFNTSVIGNTVKIRHVVTCSGNQLFDETTDYHFINQGIYVGSSTVLNDDILLSDVGLTSSFNNNLPVFPVNTTHTGKLNIYGLLTIDRNTTIQDADICVLECEGINVNHNINLNLTTCNIHEPSGCNAWRGIDLGAGSNLQFAGGAISGSLYAVRTTGITPRLGATNIMFRNNYVGVFIRHNMAGMNVANSKFETPNGLPPLCGSLDSTLAVLSGGIYNQSLGFAGIVAIGASGINAGPNNFFSTLANGIWLENSTMTIGTNTGIIGNLFSSIGQNNVYGANRSGHGVILNHTAGGGTLNVQATNSFSHCYYGVRAISNTNGTRAVVANNSMTYVDNGISFEQNANGSFIGSSSTINKIVCEANGIKVISENPSTLNNILIQTNVVSLAPAAENGVLIENAQGIKIINNSILGTSNPTSNGIYLKASPGNPVQTNILRSLGTGLRFQGNCEVLDEASKVRCNVFKEALIGLYLESDAVIGPHENTGNKWDSPAYRDGSLNLIGAQHDGEIGSSHFITAPFGSKEHPGYIVASDPAAWFEETGFQVGCAPNFTGESDDRSTLAGDTALKIFPNPNNGAFTLSIGSLGAAETATLSVYDGLGRLIRKAVLLEATTMIDLKSATPGWYMLAVQKSGSTSVQQQKFYIH